MNFYNTKFETMKGKMEGLEEQAKTLAQENGRLRSDSAKMKKEISDLRSAIDEQAQYTRRDCKFNFRFAAVKVWNNLDESIKHLPLKSFKNKVMSNILQSYCS